MFTRVCVIRDPCPSTRLPSPRPPDTHSRHRPRRNDIASAAHQHRAVLCVHVPQHEPPLRQVLRDLTQLLRARAVRARFARRESLDHARPIGVGLQASDAPEAGVAERSVVEVHRVLGRDQDAHAVCAGLLHQ